MNKFTLILTLTLCGCASAPSDDAPVTTQELDELYLSSTQLLDSKNNEKGIPLLIKCAELGHPGCMQRLGNIYFSGKGLPVDFEKGRYWSIQAFNTGTSYIFTGAFAASNLAAASCVSGKASGDMSEALGWLDKSEKLLEKIGEEMHKFPRDTQKSFALEIQRNLSWLEKKRELYKQNRCT